jgi:hypothetical protein
MADGYETTPSSRRRGDPIAQGRCEVEGDAATAERGGRMAKQDYEEKYTHPELREEIKEEIKASDKGGK